MSKNVFTKNILCIGAGYVGGPTMAVIASKCPQYKVTVVDINQDRINAWNSNELPIFEPDLFETIKSCINKNLFFSTNIDNEIHDADIIFVSVNTPTKMFGQGHGKAVDLQYWEMTARNILKASKSDKIIVEKSTLPVKTAKAMERILNTNNKGIRFDVLSNPEFLAEGSAIKDLQNPDRVLIGSELTKQGLIARDQIVEIYSNWISNEHICTSDIWSAELSKLIANAFLAQRISSINSISALCEHTEANIEEISNAIGMDTRIGNKFLNASIGFGGSCFKKDILNLIYICETYGLYEVATYWENVLLINDYQKKRFVQNMLKNMFNTITGKRIAIFGVAFKANTSDTRESPAIDVIKLLAQERAKIIIYDPKAISNAKVNLHKIIKKVEFVSDPYSAAKNAHAIAILTNWNEFKTLDYNKIYANMEKPAFVFDGVNILDHQTLYDIGFDVFPLGKSALKHY